MERGRLFIVCPRCGGETAIELASLIHDLVDWVEEAEGVIGEAGGYVYIDSLHLAGDSDALAADADEEEGPKTKPRIFG